MNLNRLLLALLLLAACHTSDRSPTAGEALPPPDPPTPQAPASSSSTALRAAYVATRQAEADATYAIDASDPALRADNAAKGMALAFGEGGLRIGHAEGSLALRLRSVGCDEAMVQVASGAAPRVEKNRVTFTHIEASVDEQYINGPLGVEQGFTVAGAVACAAHDDLVLDVAAVGSVTPELTKEGSVSFVGHAGAVVYRYTDLDVVDATGRELAARMEVAEGGVRLVIDARGAVYPLAVDPLVWAQQQELTASDGAAGDAFGLAVSVSGGTAVVGASAHQVGSNANQGSAYVFVQSGTTWTQQTELIASDGAADDYFGSVSVSGGTAVVGASEHQVGTNSKEGSAYVFVQSGTTWTQQTELIASDGAADDYFGSVSVSGGTAVVGASEHQVGSNANQGSAYVFVQSGTTWTQQAELTASDGAAQDQFGVSVSVSGGTAVVGAGTHQVGSNIAQGSAYVFVQSGTTWTQQAELTASDGAAQDQFGVSVSVSGGTAVVGKPHQQVGSNAAQGSAYVFVQSGTTWTQQAKVTAADGAASDYFGVSVSVSGGTAVVGGEGSAYVFLQSGTMWTQQAELTASDGTANDNFGNSVGVSGGTAVIGAHANRVGSNARQGSAYVFTVNCATGYVGPTCQYSNATTCNGNGTAQANGACVCTAGYAGSTCQYSSAGTCNGNGSANANGSCTCASNWTGVTCSNCASGYAGYMCQYSNAVTCSGNGTAQADGSCVCTNGYVGAACQYSNGTTCDGHGTALPSGACTCVSHWTGASCNTCASGYAGSSCEYSDAMTCNGNGTVNADGSCACTGGHVGAACQYSDATTCNGHGTALSSGACTCASNWAGATCTACASGYAGSTCQYSDATTCSGHGTVDQSGVCTCASGWTGATCSTAAESASVGKSSGCSLTGGEDERGTGSAWMGLALAVMAWRRRRTMPPREPQD